MAGKSKIWGLPGSLREKINTALTDGKTIDQVHEIAVGEGAELSRSSIARYAHALSQESKELRALLTLSSALLNQIQKDGTDPKDAMLVMSTLLTARLQKQVIDPDEEFDSMAFDRTCKSLSALSKVVKDNPMKDIAECAAATNPEVQALLDEIRGVVHDEAHP